MSHQNHLQVLSGSATASKHGDRSVKAPPEVPATRRYMSAIDDANPPGLRRSAWPDEQKERRWSWPVPSLVL